MYQGTSGGNEEIQDNQRKNVIYTMWNIFKKGKKDGFKPTKIYLRDIESVERTCLDDGTLTRITLRDGSVILSSDTLEEIILRIGR